MEQRKCRVEIVKENTNTTIINFPGQGKQNKTKQKKTVLLYISDTFFKEQWFLNKYQLHDSFSLII